MLACAEKQLGENGADDLTDALILRTFKNFLAHHLRSSETADKFHRCVDVKS